MKPGSSCSKLTTLLVNETSNLQTQYTKQQNKNSAKGYFAPGKDHVTKGHNSVNNVGGVMVLVLSTLCDNALHLYHVLPKYFIGFQCYGHEQ